MIAFLRGGKGYTHSSKTGADHPNEGDTPNICHGKSHRSKTIHIISEGL